MALFREEWLYFRMATINRTVLFGLSIRQLLLCRVALGKSFLQFSAMKMAHAPPGHHSVIGRPSAGGLHFPEYVVYRGEQVCVFSYFAFFRKAYFDLNDSILLCFSFSLMI